MLVWFWFRFFDFAWDGSHMIFTNWDDNNPSSTYECPVMSGINGKWRNRSCFGKYLTFCQGGMYNSRQVGDSDTFLLFCSKINLSYLTTSANAWFWVVGNWGIYPVSGCSIKEKVLGIELCYFAVLSRNWCPVTWEFFPHLLLNKYNLS